MGFSRNPASLGARDLSHGGIVKALKAAGAVVVDMGSLGKGVPDLLVAFNGHLFVVEVKSPTTHARRAKDPALEYGEFLTDDQIAFLSTWVGPRIHIVTTPEEALAVIGLDVDGEAAGKAIKAAEIPEIGGRNG